MTSHEFYIYVHCRPSGEPFYVGKGDNKRAWQFKKSKRNKHHQNIVAKYGQDNIQIYTYTCKSEQHAFECEIWMIAYGRSQGWRLTNQTDGGEGASGNKHKDKAKNLCSMASQNYWTDEARTNKSKQNIKRWSNAELRAKQSVACKLALSPLEVRKKISEGQIQAMASNPEKYRANKLAATNARWAKPGMREAASARLMGNKFNKFCKK